MQAEQIGDYEVLTGAGSSLDSGTFGFVTKGQRKKTKVIVAMKRIQVDEKRISRERMEKEVEMMKVAAGNEHILKLFYHTMKNGFMWLVVEYCEGGDLNTFLLKNVLSECVARQVVMQCVAEISHLHVIQVVHGNVKPQNYLITYVDGKILVKVCDFGLSTTIPDATLHRLNTFCSSQDYMAPELFQDYVSNTMAVDVFAVGMVIWAMVHREPKCGLKALKVGDRCLGMKWEREGEAFYPFPADASNDGFLKSLAMEMMGFVPKSRPSIFTVSRVIKGYANEMDGQENEIERLRREVAEMRTRDLNTHQQELHSEEGLQKQKRDMSLDSESQHQDAITSESGVPLNVTTTTSYPTWGTQKKGASAASVRHPSPSQASPMIISTVPSVRKLQRVQLSYKANRFIGVSKQGFVLEVRDELCRWVVQGGVVKEGDRVELPEAVRETCDKYELPDGRWVFQYNTNTRTYILSADLTQVLREHSGEYGRLRGVVRDALLYVEQVNDKYELSLYSISDHSPVTALPLCVGGPFPSVCALPSSCHFAVSDLNGQTLDVYSSPATHTQRQRLQQRPSLWNSVAATDQVIVVTQLNRPTLSVHAWDGRQLGEVEMGVKEGCLHGVGTVEGGKIFVAAGDDDYPNYNVTALYLLELC